MAPNDEPLVLRRIALCLQYEGNHFCGWQRQREGQSVQGVLENTIQQLDPYKPIRVIAAGRTDSGVHAAGQVVHFDCCGPIPPKRWMSALNGRLPKSIRVRDAIEKPLSWHACYSAIYRRYRYLIYNGCRPNLFLSNWSWHRYAYRLDEKLMRVALKGLLGYHDFSAFQRSGSNRANAYTTIQAIELERYGDLISIEIQATGFLYGMIRLLVGQLVALGEHRIGFDVFENRWQHLRRDQVKEAAPANGLCFLRAGYEMPVFPEFVSIDSFPKYSLRYNDSPPKPPIAPLESGSAVF